MGLIALGVLTVVAGFLSGQATFQYALSADARQVATQWVKSVDAELFSGRSDAHRLNPAGRFVVLAPRKISEYREEIGKNGHDNFRIARSVHGDTGLLSSIDGLFSGWITNLTQILGSDSHVSNVGKFALLDSAGSVVIRSQDFKPDTVNALLEEDDLQSELHKAMGLLTTRVINDFAEPGQKPDAFRKALIIPVIEGRKVSRVYVVEVDQSSAAPMSKVALVAASLMTGLLIVLGYSVPVVVAFRRFRERRKSDDKLRFLAMHDPLTGLSNRVQLQDLLREALARAQRRDAFVAIMCIDLDRFKEVNDTLGHRAGDTLLREASDRLRKCVRKTDSIARVGGDEFVVVAEDLSEPTEAMHLARRICRELSRTFEVEGHDLAISCSVGITFAPMEGTDADTLLNNADLALYRAKNDGRNTFRFFEPEMDLSSKRRRSLAEDLRHALTNGELQIHYQPQFDLMTGALTGYEALARWIRGEQGEVEPAHFIPLAEENGLITMLGEWVLMTACRYARHWPSHVKLSVNVSPAQFMAQDLAGVVRRILEETGFPPERLVLEITEELLLRDGDETAATLKEIAAMGVLLALDDFGVGYSSLSYLTELPMAKIKIDRSFIAKIENDDDMNAMVNTIIGIGKSLNMTVSAEGVESKNQIKLLRAAGCDEVQGFLCGPPTERVSETAAPLADTLCNFAAEGAQHPKNESGDALDGSVEIETERRCPFPPAAPVGELSQLLPNQAVDQEQDEDRPSHAGNVVHEHMADVEAAFSDASVSDTDHHTEPEKLAG